MTLVMFSDGLPETNSDSGAEAPQAAGFEINRLPKSLHRELRLLQEDDHVEAIAERPFADAAIATILGTSDQRHRRTPWRRTLQAHLNRADHC
jgi:hypothetical protein